MSDLFGGTLNFTPAFTGQELAIRAGGGMASAFTGGMHAGTSRRQENLQEQEFAFKKKQFNDQMEALKQWSDARLSALGGSPFSGWENE